MANRRFWLYSLGILTLITLLSGWGVNRYLIDQRVDTLEARLMLQNNLRREALARYLETAEAELRFWSTNATLVGYQHYLSLAWNDAIERGVDPQQRLRQVYMEENPYPARERRKFVDTPQDSAYRTMHSQLHPLSSMFVPSGAIMTSSSSTPRATSRTRSRKKMILGPTC